MDDEEAFRVSDIENRSRKDITDWERGVEYSRALAEFYSSSQNEMAAHLNISRSWLSRLLDVVRLPEEIIAAFSDRHDITVRVARDIKPLTGEQRALASMTKEAARIAAERDDLGVRLSGPEVAKRLVKSTLTQKASADAETEVQGRDGKVILRYTRIRRGGLTLKVLPKTGATKDELLSAIEGILEAR